MKKLRLSLCMACVILCSDFSFSQSFLSSSVISNSPKSELFSKTGSITNCSEEELNSIFLKTDSVVFLSIGDYHITADIQARIKTDNHLERINAQSSGAPACMISISRIPMSDGSFVYHGIIMNPDYPDALVLCKIGTGYCFMKTETRLLRTE